MAEEFKGIVIFFLYSSFGYQFCMNQASQWNAYQNLIIVYCYFHTPKDFHNYLGFFFLFFFFFLKKKNF
jgi:hypothetical protein